jgi:DMSO/TMAO reductase YedYZ molybdopterin-dependent catalytic subunit
VSAVRVPSEADFTSRLRSAAVASRVGLWLGVCFGIAFLTGLFSHWSQIPDPPLPVPTRPWWGYRVTQGVHVTAGVAAVPLLLVKLWSVYPKLFERPPSAAVRRVLAFAAEKASIAVLVAAAVFQLATGLANQSTWYPWEFSFRTTHYAVAWIAVGALLLHVAVRLPVIRGVLRADVEDDTHSRPMVSASASGLSRRGLLRTTWLAAGVAVVATAGSTVTWLRDVSVLGVRSGDGPQGVPVNKSALAARVTGVARDPGFRLSVGYDGREVSLSRADLASLPQTTVDLPIACVEGWSAMGTWRGPRVRELLDLVGAPDDSTVRVASLQPAGPFRATTLPGPFADDPLTLLALELNGGQLHLDHGYPCRVIAPNRPGVLQTKWVTRLEVVA